MKKKIIPIILIILIIAAITAAVMIIKKQKEKENYNENVEIYTQEEENKETIGEKEPEYKDENNVPISLYIEQGDQLVKISEYSCDWSPENVLNK